MQLNFVVHTQPQAQSLCKYMGCGVRVCAHWHGSTLPVCPNQPVGSSP